MNLDYLINQWRRVVDLTVQHLELTATAVVIALAIALPLGVLVATYREVAPPVLWLLGAIYTIPSLAFLALLIPTQGLGRRPALIALVAYAQIFLVRNIAAGLRGVDRATLEAARGLGMTAWQVFRKVRLPLALPVVIAGIRIAFVTTISLATVAAWINAGGLGALLFDGISRNNPSQILAGAIAITALAVLADVLLRLVERTTSVARARRATGRR